MHVHCTIAHHVTLPFSILLPYAPLLRTAHHEDSLSIEYTDYKQRQPAAHGELCWKKDQAQLQHDTGTDMTSAI